MEVVLSSVGGGGGINGVSGFSMLSFFFSDAWCLFIFSCCCCTKERKHTKNHYSHPWINRMRREKNDTWLWLFFFLICNRRCAAENGASLTVIMKRGEGHSCALNRWINVAAMARNKQKRTYKWQKNRWI